MKFSAFIRNGAGTRWNTTSAGSFLDQASTVGSKALQCGHAYEKNSSTSILPGASSGTGGSTFANCWPSVGVPAWADAVSGTAAAPKLVARRAAEQSRRFTFKVL